MSLRGHQTRGSQLSTEQAHHDGSGLAGRKRESGDWRKRASVGEDATRRVYK